MTCDPWLSIALVPIIAASIIFLVWFAFTGGGKR